jgi:hypothetical protein
MRPTILRLEVARCEKIYRANFDEKHAKFALLQKIKLEISFFGGDFRGFDYEW